MSKKTKLMLGDNITSLKKLPDNSIDSFVTDPPYGLSFMNKKWDYDVPSVEFWKEVYRVLKPGGHILSFGGTRTYHRMVVNIEDAGFEIRDQIMWLYGSGFPKSHNIGKAVDKLEGNEREVVGKSNNINFDNKKEGDKSFYDNAWSSSDISRKDIDITKGTSPWEGWGTALKPANEPICVARKPLSEKSVAENVLRWRTGGINVDGCRIETNRENERQYDKEAASGSICGDTQFGKNLVRNDNWLSEGRFPANIILECICNEVIKGENNGLKKLTFDNFGNGEYGKKDGRKTMPTANEIEGTWYRDKGDIHTNPMCPCYVMDSQSGVSKARSKYREPDISSMTYYDGKENEKGVVKGQKKEQTKEGFTDKGGASRFFYQAKVSKAERNMGLDDFEEKEKDRGNDLKCGNCGLWILRASGESCKCGKDRIELRGKAKNTHPTVKPVSLMAYLCRLITPPNGIVLDPFMGSGSTGISALLEGFRFVGMEMDADYFKIAERRIENYEQYRKFIKK
jgi:site-specific DNA-methyltransferase (adenine-specific)